MSKPNEYDTYIIPPNFIEGGTFFGGLLKLRNTAEALVIVLAIGIPVFSVSALTLTAKIIILCLTALPLGIIALVGINGESLSSFIFLVLKYLCNRRIITRNEEGQDKRKKRKKRKAKSGDDAPKYINPVAEYLPVEKIENGIIYTRDHRYLKIVEVVPINFLLRSAREQRNIIYSFISFLKISPVKMQIKVIAKRADLNRHREIVQQEMAQETDENCRLLQQDYLTLIDRIGAREATSRRFFMVFEYEAWAGRKRDNEEAEAIASLQTAARTAVNYLKQCGNEVLIPENDDEFTVDTLYHLLCRNTTTSLPDRVRRIVAQYQEKGLESEIDAIPCTEFFAPDSIDFTNGRHICIDGLYYAYLLVPSTGYKAQVPAGWLSLIVNAGDGIDLDKLTFSSLRLGSYTYKEFKAPDGYVLDDTAYSAVLNQNGQVLKVTRENMPVKGSIEVLKVDAETKQPLGGVVYRLFNADGNKVADGTTDATGKVTFSGLRLGKYVYQEISTVDGYVLDETKYDFSLTAANLNIKVTRENAPAKGSITVRKVDVTGSPLAGAELMLETSADGKTWTEVGRVTTDNTGVAKWSDLKVGAQYRITETKAPAGYTLLTEPLFTGTLDSNNRDITITACNNAGFALPFTGGTGFTTYFLFAALALMAGVYFCKKIEMKENTK